VLWVCLMCNNLVWCGVVLLKKTRTQATSFLHYFIKELRRIFVTISKKGEFYFGKKNVKLEKGVYMNSWLGCQYFAYIFVLLLLLVSVLCCVWLNGEEELRRRSEKWKNEKKEWKMKNWKEGVTKWIEKMVLGVFSSFCRALIEWRAFSSLRVIICWVSESRHQITDVAVIKWM